MSPFFILVLVVQVILIVHCVRTGRNTLWIWVLALLSLAGAIAYIAVELIPDLFRSRTARSALRNGRMSTQMAVSACVLTHVSSWRDASSRCSVPM